MTTLNVEYAKRGNIELDEQELELVSGGDHSLGDTIDQFLFAAGCILSGNTLSVKGDQLQCKI